MNEHARLDKLIRLDRRRRLRDAIEGGAQARWAYALERATEPSRRELLAYGATVCDMHKAALRAVRTFRRLEKLAALPRRH